MKKVALILSLSILVFSACNSAAESETTTPAGETDSFDTAAFEQEMISIEEKINMGAPERKDLITAAGLYEKYAELYPGTETSGDYLLKASDFNLSLGKVNKSVAILSKIIEEYPEYSRLESAYFNRANHTDLDLRDTTLAKTYYEEFLEKYPDSEMADDAQSRIENVSLSIEELVKKFEEMNKNQ